MGIPWLVENRLLELMHSSCLIAVTLDLSFALMKAHWNSTESNSFLEITLNSPLKKLMYFINVNCFNDIYYPCVANQWLQCLCTLFSVLKRMNVLSSSVHLM